MRACVLAAAGGGGGGALCVCADPWRNKKSATLRQRGAYITKLDRGSEGGAYPVGVGDDARDEPLLAGVGYFGEPNEMDAELPAGAAGDDGVTPSAEAPAQVARADAVAAPAGPSTSEMEAEGGKASGSSRRARRNSGQMPPLPPPIPPSHAAAKAATAALKAQLVKFNASTTQGLDAVVRDSSGVLAAAAAEVTCWEATELPPELAGLLKEHATGHIHQFGAATEGSEQFA